MHVDVDGGFFPCLFSFMFGLKSSLSLLIHSVMTLQETLVAEVPEKQKKLAQLKKEHGQDVYGYGAAPFDLFLCFVVFFILLFICFFSRFGFQHKSKNQIGLTGWVLVFEYLLVVSLVSLLTEVWYNHPHPHPHPQQQQSSSSSLHTLS